MLWWALILISIAVNVIALIAAKKKEDNINNQKSAELFGGFSFVIMHILHQRFSGHFFRNFYIHQLQQSRCQVAQASACFEFSRFI